MFCFYKRMIASHPVHTILNHPLVQLLQNMNWWKTDLNFVRYIRVYNPVVTIQANMHEITADPAVLSNWTLGWNRSHKMKCLQIHLQMLTSQIKSWIGTPGTTIKKRDIYEIENGSRVYIISKKWNIYGSEVWPLQLIFQFKQLERSMKNQGFNGIRTCNLRDTVAMLYQLSYEAACLERGQFNSYSEFLCWWSDWRLSEGQHDVLGANDKTNKRNNAPSPPKITTAAPMWS